MGVGLVKYDYARTPHVLNTPARRKSTNGRRISRRFINRRIDQTGGMPKAVTLCTGRLRHDLAQAKPAP